MRLNVMSDKADWIEIGKRASWWVTSAKVGNGVGLMRDERTNSYWQSDGQQPHLIDIQFEQKMNIMVTQCQSLKNLKTLFAGDSAVLRFQPG